MNMLSLIINRPNQSMVGATHTILFQYQLAKILCKYQGNASRKIGKDVYIAFADLIGKDYYSFVIGIHEVDVDDLYCRVWVEEFHELDYTEYRRLKDKKRRMYWRAQR